MPWRRTGLEWSVNDGEMVSMNGELVGGEEEEVEGLVGEMVKSLHVKGWRGAEGGNVGGERVVKLWEGLVREMEEYYQSRVRQVH